MSRRWPAVLAAIALVVGACGEGGGEGVAVESAASPSASETAGQALAEAVRIETAVDVSLAGADFAEVADPMPVAAGDLLRTDDAGFAEVTYFDGSVTRLDINTTLEVSELTDDVADAAIGARVDVGRTWNRIRTDPERGFTIDTSVAAATVRGTAFTVTCPDAGRCVFALYEGEIDVAPVGVDAVELEAPAAIEVTAAGDVTEIDLPPIDDDPWLLRNVALDLAAGFPPLPTFEPESGSLESFEGEWLATPIAVRVIGESGDMAGGSADTSDPTAFTWTDPGGNVIALGAFDGPKTITCEDGRCPIAGETTFYSLVERDGEIVIVHDDPPECQPDDPELLVARDVTADSFTFTEPRMVWVTGDCSQYFLAYADILMERTGGTTDAGS